MEELLKRWAELEPHICYIKTVADDDGIYDDIYIVSDGRSLSISGDNDNHLTSDAPKHIQYAVQQAIEARGWLYQQHSVPRLNSYSATVGDTDYWVEENNVAAALLSAYIKAIEATK